MAKFEAQFFKIGEKLIAYKNRLFEVVQYKLDEDKDKNQIIKELKEEFEPTIEILQEIECAFFKEAGTTEDNIRRHNKLMDVVTNMYNVGTLKEEGYNRVKQVYKSVSDPSNITDVDLENLNNAAIQAIHGDDQLEKSSDIKKTPGKDEWNVFTENGKPMGTYTNEGDAKKRIQQMEFWKHQNGEKEGKEEDATTTS